MVPGGGIEPPTRGFSIHCSTPELPGHGRPPKWSGERVLGGCGGCPASFCAQTRALTPRCVSAAFAPRAERLRSRQLPLQYLQDRLRRSRRSRSAISPRSTSAQRREQNGRYFCTVSAPQIGQLMSAPREWEHGPVCAAVHSGPAGSSRPAWSQPHQRETPARSAVSKRAAVLFGHRGQIQGDLPAQPAQPQRPWQGARAQAMLALIPAASEASLPVFTSTATSARVGSTNIDAPPPKVNLRLPRLFQRIQHAVGVETARFGHDLSRRQSTRAKPGHAGRRLRPRFPSRVDGVFHAPYRQAQHGDDVIGDLIVDLPRRRTTAGSARARLRPPHHGRFPADGRVHPRPGCCAKYSDPVHPASRWRSGF